MLGHWGFCIRTTVRTILREWERGGSWSAVRVIKRARRRCLAFRSVLSTHRQAAFFRAHRFGFPISPFLKGAFHA